MAPSSKLGKGKPLKNQTKHVLYKLHKYFESEIQKDPNSNVTAVQLVAHSTGISLMSLRRVVAEFKQAQMKKEYPSNKRRSKKDISSNEYDAQAIRRIIHNFYTKDEEFPITKDLYLLLKADLDYQGSLCTLRRDIAKLGFRWNNNNSVLIEKHDVRLNRVQYLTKIDAYRSQGHHVVYIGDIILEYSRAATNPKPNGSLTLLKQPTKSKVVILLAGTQDNILQNTLFMYDGNKKDLKEEIENKRENFEQYEKWFKYQLLPNLPQNSVVVIDGGSAFHNRIFNPVPHSNSKRKDMMDWLTTKNVPFSMDMYKPQLYQLVLSTKGKSSEFKTDMLLRDHGHTVLRLPPLHPDLNPVKSVLSSARDYVGDDVCLNMESVMKIAKEKILSLNEEDWMMACRSAQAEENILKATDKVVDEITERSCSFDEVSEDSDIYDEMVSDQDSMDSE